MDFDKWRTQYPTLTYQQQQEISKDWERQYPDQQYFDKPLSSLFFNETKNLPYRNVFEFGGWKGELAQFIFDSFSIDKWVNCDILPILKDKQVFSHPNYELWIPDDFVWKVGIKGNFNIFYTSDIIEHILMDEVKLLFEVLPKTVQYIYIQAPLGPKSWVNYFGSHINTGSWEDIDIIVGVQPFYAKDKVRMYKRY